MARRPARTITRTIARNNEGATASALIRIETTGGEAVNVKPGGIIRIRPGSGTERGGATVVDCAGLSIHTDEDWEALMGRIGEPKAFARLTRPDGSPVWVRKSAVDGLREPLKIEKADPPGLARSAFRVGGMRQTVRETVEEVLKAIS